MPTPVRAGTVRSAAPPAPFFVALTIDEAAAFKLEAAATGLNSGLLFDPVSKAAAAAAGKPLRERRPPEAFFLF